jgi:glycosyltransferase involved in cell wall biosynthesis
MVAIIIPAYNEEARIADVLAAAIKCRHAGEVICVSDASTDRTAQIARSIKGVKVIELPHNLGKGGAMAAGAEATHAEVLTFIDADLFGLRPDHIDSIIEPVLKDYCDMCIGIFRGGKFWSDAAQKVAPYISGQRALKRRLFDRVPEVAEDRFGVEVAINMYAKRYRARILRVVLDGVSNTHKERKLGFVKGAKERARMWNEMAHAYVKVKKQVRERAKKSRARRDKKKGKPNDDRHLRM